VPALTLSVGESGITSKIYSGHYLISKRPIVEEAINGTTGDPTLAEVGRGGAYLERFVSGIIAGVERQRTA
jgi:hypothetical protein